MRQAEGRARAASAQPHGHGRALGPLPGAEDFQQVQALGSQRHLGSNYSDILLSDQLKFHNLSTSQGGQSVTPGQEISSSYSTSPGSFWLREE